MAGWIVNASGDIEDPAIVKELFAELGAVLKKAKHNTGSSEFNSAHLAAQNFHVPDPEPQTPADATGPAGEESWRPGQEGGSPPAAY